MALCPLGFQLGQFRHVKQKLNQNLFEDSKINKFNKKKVAVLQSNNNLYFCLTLNICSDVFQDKITIVKKYSNFCFTISFSCVLELYADQKKVTRRCKMIKNVNMT